MKTAIITGITGQDGPYLAQILLRRGYKVIGTTRSYRGDIFGLQYLGINNEVIIEEVDLLDIMSVISLIKKYKPDEIYHLSGQSSVGLSFKQPFGTINSNINSTNHLLEAIRLLIPYCKFYHSASSEMYGQVDKLPITLETPMNPISPYGISKMSSYFLVKLYRESYKIYAVNGILFNHESFLRSKNFFIKKVILSAINIKRGLQNKLIVGDLNVRRDFGYAPEYMKAVWKMLQLKEPEDFIICSGKSISLRRIVEYVFNKFNINLDLIVEDINLFRPNEIQDIYGDNSKAKNLLDWKYEMDFFDVLDMLIVEELNFNKLEDITI